MSKSFRILSLVFVAGLLFSISFDGLLRSGKKDFHLSASRPESGDGGKVSLAAVRAETEPIQIAETRTALVFEAVSAPISPAAVTIPNTPTPKITATAALIEDVAGGASLLVLGPEVRWPIASLTKLMTAVVARESLSEGKVVTLTEEMLSVEGIAGNFSVGEQYTVADLIRIMLVVSSNDAAEAIRETYDAEYGAGGLVNQMNNRAQSLGMITANFADATGLSILNQATVRDLAVLVKHILQMEADIFEVTSKKEISVREVASRKRRVLLNINPLAGETRFVGGKTGFTDDAGGNLISIFAHQGRDIIIITLGSADQEKRFLDTELLYAWLTQT